MIMGLAAGDLNRQITIRAPTGAVNDLNEPLGTWNPTPAGVEWAMIRGSTGMGSIRSADTAGITRSIDAYSFRIRYNRSYAVNMRVEYDGAIFDIRAIRHDHANHDWTDLVCETGGNDG